MQIVNERLLVAGKTPVVQAQWDMLRMSRASHKHEIVHNIRWDVRRGRAAAGTHSVRPGHAPRHRVQPARGSPACRWLHDVSRCAQAQMGRRWRPMQRALGLVVTALLALAPGTAMAHAPAASAPFPELTLADARAYHATSLTRRRDSDFNARLVLAAAASRAGPGVGRSRSQLTDTSHTHSHSQRSARRRGGAPVRSAADRG